MNCHGYIKRVEEYKFSKLSVSTGDREDIYTALTVWPYGEYTIQVRYRPELRETHVHFDGQLGNGLNGDYAFYSKEEAYHYALRFMDVLSQASKLWDSLVGLQNQSLKQAESGKKKSEERECPTCGGSGEDSRFFWAPGTLYSDDGEFNATPVPLACTDCEGYGTFQP